MNLAWRGHNVLPKKTMRRTRRRPPRARTLLYTETPDQPQSGRLVMLMKMVMMIMMVMMMVVVAVMLLTIVLLLMPMMVGGALLESAGTLFGADVPCLGGRGALGVVGDAFWSSGGVPGGVPGGVRGGSRGEGPGGGGG